MLKRDQMHDYQKRAVGYILDKKKCYLAVDLGLGKTIMVLTAIADLIESGQISSAFIFAPLRVVQTVWRQEAKKWEHTKHLKFSVVHGPNKQQAFDAEADIYLMNYEGLLWMRNNNMSSLRGEMLVIDEGSAIKDPTTNRFKMLRKYSRNKEYAVVMSATPAPNSLLDLWGQYFIIDHGTRLFTSYHKFRHVCFEQTDYFGYSWRIKSGMDKIIHKRIGDITLRLDKKDYLELPGNVVVPMHVTLPPKSRKMYEQLEKEMFMQLDEDTVIDVINAATMSNKCRQICQGAVYDADGSAYHLHEEKISALKEVVEESSGSPILCAYSYRSEVPMLMRAFPDAEFINGDTKDVETLVEQWNKGQIPLLFVQPQSVSHGLNMQTGGNIIVWLGLTWSSEQWSQLIGRLDRQGQTELVRVVQIIASDTVDEVMVEVVNGKLSNQNDLLTALKSYKERKTKT